MQKNHAIFIADLRFFFCLQGKNGLWVLILHFIHIGVVFSIFFLFVCQLRFIDRGLNTLAVISDRDLLAINFNQLTIVLLHLRGEVFFAARHGLKERDAFLMRFDYDLVGTWQLNGRYLVFRCCRFIYGVAELC